ncbi:MAG: phospholipase D-like domain-containing protein [Novosphingobium sp.]|nr:phospholipase D-like domain-containing protein [Novosphingobium sp.]
MVESIGVLRNWPDADTPIATARPAIPVATPVPASAPQGDIGVSPSVWRRAKSTRAHVVVDAAAYFETIQAAMMNARQRIMLIGWDFDTRISLSKSRSKPGGAPTRLGDFIVWLADRTPGLEIKVLKWNFGTLKMLGRGSTMLDVARWAMHSQIEMKLDSAHPFGCSHHQKIVVIDDKFAVCGGIDMTSDRWDTPCHLDNDARRKRPGGKPYGPWHDVTMLVENDAAAALGELSRMRWERAGGSPLQPCKPQQESPWPAAVNAEFQFVEMGISRTRAEYEDCPPVFEIESLFLEQIARAKRFIYAENQYFASRKIAEAIARRMAEPDPPEIFIVTAQNADGWLEQKAMDSARARLVRSIGEKDTRNRFSINIPYTANGTPIYVHAKLMIVDDEILRVGSANMNNRSLGLDSECDVHIDSTVEGNGAATSAITNLRHRLLAEHCGVSPERMAETLNSGATMREAVERLSHPGRRLERLVLAELTEAEKTLADQEVLDPETPAEFFEPFAKKSLFSRSRILGATD